MEKGFDPSGWLGIIIGSKLFFDFSGKYPFEKKMPELIREIQLHLKKVTDCSLATKVATALKMEGDPIENSKGAGTKKKYLICYLVKCIFYSDTTLSLPFWRVKEVRRKYHMCA